MSEDEVRVGHRRMERSPRVVQAPNPAQQDRVLPPDACDCHMHVLGPLSQYTYQEPRSFTPPEALWEDYAPMAKQMGLSRCVVVQPSVFGTDNRCTLDTVSRVEIDAVAVVVVSADVSEPELADMHARGARAIRLQTLVAGATSFDAIELLAKKIKRLGWHIEVYLDTQDLPDYAQRFRQLGVPIVFDHMGQWHEGDRVEEEGFQILLDMVGTGRAWVKLANPRFEPSTERARQLIAANPERIVWGSDWPHILGRGTAPALGERLRQLSGWLPDERCWYRTLVSNPAALYFH